MLERLKIKDKKGDVTDMLIFMILVFTFGSILFIFTFIVPELTDGLRAGGLNNTPEGTNAIDRLESFGSQGIQRGFFLLFMGFIISTFITSFLVRTHPIFIFLYLFILALTILVGTYLGNAYEDISNIPLLSDQLASQGLINIVFENYVLILLGVGAMSMFIVFAKFSTFGGSGGDTLG